MTDTRWLIWSNERDAWWGPNSGGYFACKESAGSYTRDDAERICRIRSSDPGAQPPEVMFPDDRIDVAALREELMQSYHQQALDLEAMVWCVASVHSDTLTYLRKAESERDVERGHRNHAIAVIDKIAAERDAARALRDRLEELTPQLLDALESDATLDQRRDAFDALRDLVFPVSEK